MQLIRRAGLYVVLLGAVSVLSYGAGRVSPYLAQALERAFESTSEPCALEEDQSACWRSYYRERIAAEGAIAALSDLEERYNTGGYPRYFCHALLHDIGEAAGVEFGNIADAYAQGRTFCRAGYYHGVLEGLFGEDDSGAFLSQLDSVCATVAGKERYSYTYFSCVHGIGHGLMAYFNHDVFKSLAGCDKLSGTWEQTSCYGGVFMENVIGNNEVPSRFLKSDDLLYPCTAVLGPAKNQCYAMQSSYVLSQNGGDFKHAFDVCADIEPEYANTCFMSIGRDASGWSYGSADVVDALCMEAGTSAERTQCIIGAAVDYIQSVDGSAALALCERLESASRATCLQTVNWHLSSQ